MAFCRFGGITHPGVGHGAWGVGARGRVVVVVVVGRGAWGVGRVARGAWGVGRVVASESLGCVRGPGRQ